MTPLQILLAVLVIAIIGYGGYLFAPIVRAVRDTKPLMEATVPYVQNPTAPSMRILVMGDSTVVGTGGRPEESIAGRLGARYPEAMIVNDSENGLKLEAFLDRLEVRTEERYDLVVFQIGANDVIGMTPEEDIRARLTTALEQASVMAPHIIVICAGNVGLAPVFRWPLSALYTERSRSVRKLYLEVIALYPTARYVDLFNEREDEPFNKDIERYYAADRFHPSGDGYGIWFEKVEAALADAG